jgi:hypothetical protein
MTVTHVDIAFYVLLGMVGCRFLTKVAIRFSHAVAGLASCSLPNLCRVQKVAFGADNLGVQPSVGNFYKFEGVTRLDMTIRI